MSYRSSDSQRGVITGPYSDHRPTLAGCYPDAGSLVRCPPVFPPDVRDHLADGPAMIPIRLDYCADNRLCGSHVGALEALWDMTTRFGARYTNIFLAGRESCRPGISEVFTRGVDTAFVVEMGVHRGSSLPMELSRMGDGWGGPTSLKRVRALLGELVEGLELECLAYDEAVRAAANGRPEIAAQCVDPRRMYPLLLEVWVLRQLQYYYQGRFALSTRTDDGVNGVDLVGTARNPYTDNIHGVAFDIRLGRPGICGCISPSHKNGSGPDRHLPRRHVLTVGVKCPEGNGDAGVQQSRRWIGELRGGGALTGMVAEVMLDQAGFPPPFDPHLARLLRSAGLFPRAR